MNLGRVVKRLTGYIWTTQRRDMREASFPDIPDVSVSSIRGHLKRCGVNYEERHMNFVVGCPTCEKGGEPISERAKIFINKRTGAFSCEYCHHTGPWIDMESYMRAKNSKQKVNKDPVIIKELEKLQTYLRTTKKNTIQLNKISQDEYIALLEKFNLPNSISQNTMNILGVRTDITKSNLYFPLYNTAHALVGFKVLRQKSASTIEPKLANSQSTGVMLWKSPRSKETAVIVADPADFLVLVEAQVTMNVVCIPNGLVGLSQHVLPCFERFSKMVLWLGNNLTAWDTSRSYAKKLGERRCFIISPSDKTVLPQEDPSIDFKAILSSAQPIWHKSIVTFSSLREEVLADLMNIDKVQGIKWMKFPTLNRILKGHRRGELTVFTGPTGCGKTTFISEYSLDLAQQGVNTLWGSFEIRNARLARTMLQQMAGIPLDENVEKYDYWADQFEQLPIYYMTFHGQQSVKVVMEAIEHATYVHDISHVIIDNLQFMMGMSEDSRNMDRFWKQDLIIASFRTFATRKNCHVTLVIHPRKEKEAEDLSMSSIFGGAKASQEADNILIIQDKRLVSVKGRKYLQVAKNRYTGDLGIMPLEFDKSSLSFAPKKKKVTEKSETNSPDPKN